MICKSCKETIPEGSAFCPSCGQKVEAETTTEPICEGSGDTIIIEENIENLCPYCGSALDQDAKFCSICGKKLDESLVKRIKNNLKGLFVRSKKAYAIVTSAIVGVLVIAILVLAIFVFPNMEVNAFKKQIKNREYRDAYRAYEDFDSHDQTKANKWIREYIGFVEEDYYAGKLDYSTATGILEELMQFEAAYNEATKTGENVYLDHQSSIAFEKAKGYAEEKKWQEAYRELQNVHVKYRLSDEVSTLRTECITNVRADAIQKINDFATSGEIDKLIAARDLALDVLPDDKDIIQAAQTHLDAFVTKTLADAKTMADSKDYGGAIELLQYAVGMYNHQDFSSALGEYGYIAAEAHCEALVAQNDLLGAVKHAKGLAVADSKYSTLLEKYARPLVDQTMATAKTYADSRQFAEAIALITSVQAVYNHAELQAAFENYNTYLPRKLSECHQIDCSYYLYVLEGNYADSFGKKHEGAINFRDDNKTTYAVYSLEGKFVKLSGALVPGEAHNGSATIKIYVDNNLVYESKAITRTTEAFDFSVDVTGGNQLKIEVLNNQDYAVCSFVIMDATVS